MAKPTVLQTRCVGQATHYSRHPLAPQEYVYEVEGGEIGERRKPKTTVLERVHVLIGLASAIYVIYIIGSRLLQVILGL